ncbi:immunoglobulin E-set [Scheffersomyces coipomensis]|uniref:immunoglobulin E-set n=1 Tax=Scheffersomyces coipomensis TaxID=1788519 RepID=UPI00315DE298
MSERSIEERQAEFSCDLLDIEQFIVNVDGHEESPLVYRRDDEQLPNRVHFLIPEGANYNITIKYKVKKRPLKKTSFHQIVKKRGFTVRDRKVPMHDDADVNIDEDYVHEAILPHDQVPSGFLVRGQYSGQSFIYEDDEVIWNQDFIFEIIKKGNKPTMGGYD